MEAFWDDVFVPDLVVDVADVVGPSLSVLACRFVPGRAAGSLSLRRGRPRFLCSTSTHESCISIPKRRKRLVVDSGNRRENDPSKLDSANFLTQHSAVIG